MGSGGKFVSEKVPTGTIVTCYAALGNLRDAVEQTERMIDAIGQDPNNSEAWKGLELYAERLKSRGMTLVVAVKSLIQSQQKG